MLVFGLFIAPDFTPAMERGIEPPPYINHDTVDWLSLGAALSDYFEVPQQGVKLRLANDTVDQMTIHMREFDHTQGPLNCSDFGNILLRVASQTQDSPVPVREAWRNLHHLPDRTKAPPPIMIPLVFEGEHEDILSLAYTMKLRLRVKAAEHPEKLFSGESLPEDFHQGYLPESVISVLANHFGVGYKPYAVLVPLVPVIDV